MSNEWQPVVSARRDSRLFIFRGPHRLSGVIRRHESQDTRFELRSRPHLLSKPLRSFLRWQIANSGLGPTDKQIIIRCKIPLEHARQS